MLIYKNILSLCANIVPMDLKQITQFITSVGFPIAMCVALFYYMIKQNDKHEHEVNGLKDTLTENTKVLAELRTLIQTLIK